MSIGFWFLFALAIVGIVVIHDLIQRKHAILRNFPIIGHFRYLFESVGPELRQYIVTNNDEERPFSRDQRRWVYASAKKENDYFGFGTDNDMETAPNYLILKHSAFPLRDSHPGDPCYDPSYRVPSAKVLGAAHGRRRAFRPDSVINVSGMSYGSLGAHAVEALNRGCKLADCLQNTGEGGVSVHHLAGGQLIWQVGTGYFGCRNDDGTFSLEKVVQTVERHSQIRAIEVKLSQGAKPGLGGVLPAAKVSPTIAAVRGIRVGRDCISPSRHSAFDDVPGLIAFVESLAEATGLPVGIKSAVGDGRFWTDLARAMAETERGPDFITIDGGEGGTGAGPLAFTDHVALPFKIGFSRVYRAFAERHLTDQVTFVGSGRLGFPEVGLLAFALGCDMIAVAREAMMAIGCIQAQRCHTGHCPTGVATHNRWLMRGLDPTLKSARLANYVVMLRKELLRLSRACGVPHPSLVTLDGFEILDDRFGSQPARAVFGYPEGMAVPSSSQRAEIERLMNPPEVEMAGPPVEG